MTPDMRHDQFTNGGRLAPRLSSLAEDDEFAIFSRGVPSAHEKIAGRMKQARRALVELCPSPTHRRWLEAPRPEDRNMRAENQQRRCNPHRKNRIVGDNLLDWHGGDVIQRHDIVVAHGIAPRFRFAVG